MKNGTNLFFLIVAAGFVYFGWREYQKQVEAQKALQRQQQAEALLPG